MKELNFNYTIARSLAALCVMACLSCSDDLESKDLKVYVVTPAGGSKVEAVVNHPTSEGKLVMKLPVRSTRELVADATIEAMINESLVAGYNKQHGTEYKLLPTSVASIFDKATLKEGYYESEDSLGFACPDVTKMEEPGYILPITVSNLSTADKGLAISNNLNTVYFVINVREYRMYNTKKTEGNLKDRTGWTVKGTDGKEYSELFDGNVKTGINENEGKLLLTVDMGSVSSIKGLRFTPRNMNAFDLDLISVEVSENGQEWHSLKELTLNAPVNLTPGGVGFQNVAFFKTWLARYIKVEASRVGSSIMSVSEIDVVE